METAKKAAVVTGIAAAFAAAALVVSHSSSSSSGPLERIDVNTNCIQTMSQQPQLVVYTGNVAATVFQYGFEAVDVVAGREHHRNGLGKNSPKVCSSPVLFVGDCWQSVSSLAATPNTPKWIVAKGAPNLCDLTSPPVFAGLPADGLAVWKWKDATSTFEWFGFIPNQTDRTGPRPILDGDVAYAVQNGAAIPQLWTKFDLNALAVVSRDLPAPTNPPAPQDSIQGYTYTIAPDFRTPPAPEGPARFTWTRHGGPAATPTAGAPSPSPAPVTAVPPLCPTCAATCPPTTATRTASPTRTPCLSCTATPTPQFQPAKTRTPTPKFGP